MKYSIKSSTTLGFVLVFSILLITRPAVASDFSEFLGHMEGEIGGLLPAINDFFCNGLGLKDLPEIGCTDNSVDVVKDILVPSLTGRWVIAQYGCGTTSFDPVGDKDKHYVALLGDSLTHFGGPFWDSYYASGKYKVMNLGAMGATSDAWREHFDNCEAHRNDFLFSSQNIDQGRMRLPPRSLMMIGGNDFHIYKGILQPLWFLIDLRHNNVLNNVERIITHHHKGNDGCGDRLAEGEVCDDVTEDGIIDYQDWGRGRLFVYLGNIPAVSYDPTTDPILVSLFSSLDLFTMIAFDVPTMVMNEEEAHRYTRGSENWGFVRYWSRRMLDAYIDVMMDVQVSLGIKDHDKNHSWDSREMHVLQANIYDVMYRRHGFGYVPLYGKFRDTAANQRGCYWCANEDFWIDGNLTLNDGIHINHVQGYANWAWNVLPAMEAAGMDSPVRTDPFGPPGVEVTDRPAINDWLLILACFWYHICEL